MQSTYDYLIVGGGPAGTIAAEEIRKIDATSSIGILTDEPHPLYSRILLPNFLRDEVKREQLFLRPKNFYGDNKIDLLKGSQAEVLDSKARTITTNQGLFQFKKLLIACGGKVSKWSVPGSEKTDLLFNLRTIEDAEMIRLKLDGAKRAVIVGGGFISLEFVNACLKHSVKPIMLVREPYFWSNLLSADQSRLITANLTEKGVEIITNDEAHQIKGEINQVLVITKNGRSLKADLIGVGIGIKLQTEWLTGSGLAVNKGVLTNEYLETNLPNVWAAGDIAEYQDITADKVTLGGNWNNAREQGKAVALNMAASKASFRYVSNYSITSQGLNTSFVGSVNNDPETQVVDRLDINNRRAGQIMIRDNQIVGATLINMLKEKAALLKLIADKTPIATHQGKLSDPNFDLNTIQ